MTQSRYLNKSGSLFLEAITTGVVTAFLIIISIGLIDAVISIETGSHDQTEFKRVGSLQPQDVTPIKEPNALAAARKVQSNNHMGNFFGSLYTEDFMR